MSRRSRPPVCKRRGCSCARERWQLVCPACWLDIPAAFRARYSRARRARLTRIAGEIGREILRLLGPRSSTAPSGAQVYARNQRMMGERDDGALA